MTDLQPSVMNPINIFNSDVERGKYVTFAAKYISDNRDTIQKSIDGFFDEERKRWIFRRPRGSEHPDIDWSNVSSSDDVLSEAIWNIYRYRIVNLKVCCDRYAADIGLELKDFYTSVNATLPSLKFILPNGSQVSPFDVLQLTRHLLAHANDPKHQAERKKLGINDVRSFMSINVCFFDDGFNQRLASYNPFSQRIQAEMFLHSGVIDYEQGCDSFCVILEEEICNAINAYDAIR